MSRLAVAVALAAVLVPAVLPAQTLPPRERRGRDEADCRPNEPGPAYRLTITGMKDRRGRLWLDLYPATQNDFLAPDRELIQTGTPFRRVIAAVPQTGPVTLCIRAPGPGRWALSVLHDRDGDGRFGFLRDGAGFPRNPVLRRAKPDVNQVALPVTRGVVEATVIMNYRRGLGFGPIG